MIAFQDELVTLYHARWEDVAHVIPDDAAIVSDPPYGMKWNADSTRFSGGGRRRGDGVRHAAIVGDAEPFDPSPWLRYPSVILFGSNHYAQRLPVGTTLVWIKKQQHLFGTFLSDAEVAWMKGGHGVYCHESTRGVSGRITEANGNRPHPTQKPLSLMTWCLGKVPADRIVVDPFCGSGTTLVAARAMGRRAIGIECEVKYVDLACKRLAQAELFGGAA